MRLETFFEKFELLADAPNAVAKMREMVLELAIQGKLVSQDCSDEPASKQLGRVAEKKFEAGRVVRAKPSRAGTAATVESATHIPDGWAKTSLAELVTVLNGRAYSKDELLSSGTPVLRVGNLFTSNHWYYSDINLEADKYCDKGDLIFAWSASFGPFIWPGPKVIYHYHIWKLELHSESDLSKHYLYWFLQNKTQEIKRAGHGVSMLHMTKEKMEKLEIMVPPLAEQKRIVAKVDELMALCDRLEAQQQERDARHAALARASLTRFAEAPTPANLEFLFRQSYPIAPADLRKAITSLAVQGKLVPQDPNDEPGEDFLRRIAGIRSSLNAKTYSSIEADVYPYDIPESWTWTRLGSISLKSDSGWSPQCLPERRTGKDWGVLKVSAISWGVFQPEENKALPSEMTARSECEVRAGDFLMSRANTEELVARSVIVEQTPPHLMMSDKIVRFTFPDEIEKSFVNLANSSSFARDYYARCASGTSSSMKNIGREVMCNLPIPLPPRAEQRRIVAKVDQLMVMVDQLEAQLAKAKAKSTALLDAIIHELLNPSAEIIDLATYRAAIGCYAIRKMSGQRYFGRTVAMKVFYLAQAHVGLELGLQPMREAAGPLDPWIYRFEEHGERNDWFKIVENTTASGKKKIEYRPGQGIAEQSAQAERLLSASQRKDFDRLFDLMADKKTDEAEIIATLFAAWNDFLIDGQTPGDDGIVTEVREHWHESKQRFTPQQLRQWLAWMRDNDLVPKGKLPRTVHQTNLFTD